MVSDSDLEFAFYWMIHLGAHHVVTKQVLTPSLEQSFRLDGYKNYTVLNRKTSLPCP